MFHFIQSYGIYGVVNYPTISLIDGQFREALTAAQINFSQEIAFLRAAHHQGLFTVAFVTNVTEALQAQAIPVDIICIHLGLTSGGRHGASQLQTLREIVQLIQDIVQALKEKKATSFVMIYGGILTTAAEVQFVYQQVAGVDGFIGGSALERIIPEQSLGEQIRVFKNSPQTATESTTKSVKNYYDPVKFVESFIQEHYAESIRLQDLAVHLHLSAPYLSKIFKAQTAFSFTEYLITFRLNQALELMTTTNQPLNTIAAAVGYSDYAQFQKIFKKRLLLSPQNYKNQRILSKD
ncbi:phosphoenolpyruvate hydrolase family protein [Bombilactobacillus apium]|uniref:phosphoenolpyruvate hydrolase family protein n=1 Tax=Bombilactobacillus apium TaxID=2675299 RepID=UPI00226BD6DA|nr:phosphoenolpyruvate hydrolase family protein [Bombilactobacillus apium]